MNIKNLALGICVLPIMATANAEEMSYTYIEGSLGRIEIFDEDGSTAGISGSLGVGSNFFIGGSATSAISDDEYVVNGVSDELTISTISIGAGYHHSLDNNLDLVLGLAFGNIEGEHAGLGSDDENFTTISAGLRGRTSDKIELSGGVSNTRADGESETAFSLGIRGYVNDSLSIGAGYSSADDVDQLSINIRGDL